MIYLDNAATTIQKPQEVIDAVTQAMTSCLGNCGRGAHQASLQATRVIYTCREQIAALFNAPTPSCVAFTSNATEALNTAILGTLQSGDHVITTANEHNSVLRPLFFQKKNGIHLDIVPIDAEGCINYRALEKLVTIHTKAIVITLASNVTGKLTDLSRIGNIIQNIRAKRIQQGYDDLENHGYPLLIADATQAAGSFDIDMQNCDGHNTHIDILCFTGHKGLMGPQGTGGICVMPDITIQPLKRGGSGVDSYNQDQPNIMPTLLESGTLNGHGIAGLSAALAYIKKTGMQHIRVHEQEMTQFFYDGIKDIPGIHVYGTSVNTKTETLEQKAPIISLTLGNLDSAELCDILATDYGIATRAGAHCAPLVHKSFGTQQQGMVRFSFGWFTTKDDLIQAIHALQEIQLSI
ncbi:MAG: aminotransferase class V-fold PLP-dependent enzyme [Treponema sp.]|nr:aminotransferase class V-fold PLP-dependent enzyme [Treponema sp.]